MIYIPDSWLNIPLLFTLDVYHKCLGYFIRRLLRCSFQSQSNIIYNVMLQLMTVHAMKQVTTISQYLLMDVKALLNVPPSFQRRHKTVQKVYCSMLLSAVVITLIWWAARLIVRELQHYYQQQHKRVCVIHGTVYAL